MIPPRTDDSASKFCGGILRRLSSIVATLLSFRNVPGGDAFENGLEDPLRLFVGIGDWINDQSAALHLKDRLPVDVVGLLVLVQHSFQRANHAALAGKLRSASASPLLF